MTEKELQAYLQGYSSSGNGDFTSNIETEEELQAYLQGRCRSQERIESRLRFEDKFDLDFCRLRRDAANALKSKSL